MGHDPLHDEIEELFGELWRMPGFGASHRGFRPNVDSFHTSDPHELTVVIELPGVEPASVTIAVSQRTLVISGERVRAKAAGRVYQQMEIEYGPFQRQIRLAEDVDPEQARARYEHGVVTVSLPVSDRPARGGRFSIEVERR